MYFVMFWQTKENRRLYYGFEHGKRQVRLKNKMPKGIVRNKAKLQLEKFTLVHNWRLISEKLY